MPSAEGAGKGVEAAKGPVDIPGERGRVRAPRERTRGADATPLAGKGGPRPSNREEESHRGVDTPRSPGGHTDAPSLQLVFLELLLVDLVLRQLGGDAAPRQAAQLGAAADVAAR